MRQLRIGVLHSLGEGVHHLRLHLIGEMTHGGGLGRAAPVILNRLVLCQRVGDQGKQPGILPEHLAEAFRRLLAQFRVGTGQQVQNLLRGKLFAIQFELEAGHCLIKQPHPGAAPGDFLLMQQLLHLIGELIGLQRPHIVEPGLIFFQAAALIHALQLFFPDAVQFQREEQQISAGGADFFLHGLEEFCDVRIRHIARINEIGIGHDPPFHLADFLEFRDGEIEPLPVQAQQLALILRGESFCILRHRLQILEQFRGGAGRIQIAQIPFGQIGKGGFCHE